CGACPRALDVVCRRRARVFGLGEQNAWRVTDLEDDGATRFTIRERGRAVCRVALQLPGAINARNALGVMLLAVETGIGWEEGAAALGEFRGVRRREGGGGGGRGGAVVGDFAPPPPATAGRPGAPRPRHPG